MALYMLDTDTCSFLVRGRNSELDAKVASVPLSQLCISSVTRAELLYGLALKEGAHKLAQVVDELLAHVDCLPWDAQAASAFAGVAARLSRAGTPIGSMDAMIASHALALGAVLVTNNGRHFSRVEGLVLENWVTNH